ncbi:MAG: DUF4242 domain-containing protein [Pricia sp.]|nr:DUF4242 domain-containing protein [Pricia sp.]
MDIHIVEDEAFSEIAAQEGHHRDIAMQHKYGVKNIKYFLNLPEKKVFCLMQAPNKKACINNHMAAHGIGACNIIEVSSEIDFKAFLGEGGQDENDMAITLSGEIDTGYRSIIMICPIFFEDIRQPITNRIYKLIEEHKGSRIIQPGDRILASFVDADHAVKAVQSLSEYFRSFQGKLEYNMALVTGKPVDEEGIELFEETKKHLVTINEMCKTKVPQIDSTTLSLARKPFGQQKLDGNGAQVLSGEDLYLYSKLWNILDKHIVHTGFSSAHLSKEFGLSKAQMYRKLKALTGMSPNELIREMRLRRSLSALKKNNKNVSEIAYGLGFNSPTYFTRVFRKRYDILPTEFAKLSNRHRL